LCVETTIRLIIVASAGVTAYDGAIPKASNTCKPWVAFNFYAPALVFSKVPVKIVELIKS